MRPVNQKCPNCGAPLVMDFVMRKARCEYCESTFMLDDDDAGSARSSSNSSSNGSSKPQNIYEQVPPDSSATTGATSGGSSYVNGEYSYGTSSAGNQSEQPDVLSDVFDNSSPADSHKKRGVILLIIGSLLLAAVPGGAYPCLIVAVILLYLAIKDLSGNKGGEHDAGRQPSASSAQSSFAQSSFASSPRAAAPTVSSKSRLVASVLCLFFGIFGAHYFYVNRYVMGTIYLCTLGLLGVGWVVDVIRIICSGNFRDAHGLPVRAW